MPEPVREPPPCTLPEWIPPEPVQDVSEGCAHVVCYDLPNALKLEKRLRAERRWREEVIARCGTVTVPLPASEAGAAPAQ